ncbi:MAG: cytochrome c biogenesis protein [Akkermansiaceae bacterium]
MSEENISKQRSKRGRWIAFILVVLFLGSYGLYTIRVNVSSDQPVHIDSYKVWQDEVVEASRDIAIQDGGRIKPFSTWSGFTMLKLHGARSMKIMVNDQKTRIGPEEFMLDCLFRPELARQLPVFRVDNSDIISSLATGDLPEEVQRMAGIDSASKNEAIRAVVKGKDRRDRYSFAELESIAPILLARVQKMNKDQPEKSKMTSEQRDTVDLGEKVWLFMRLIHHMDFARANIDLEEGTPAIDKDRMRRMSYWVKSFPILRQAIQELQPKGEQLPPGIMSLIKDLEVRMLRASENIHILPPYAEDTEEWTPIGKRIEEVFSGNRTYLEELVADIESLEDANLALRDDGQKAFATKLGSWKQSVHERLDSATVDRLGSEVGYAQWNYFLRALVIFLVAFVFVMISWLAPQSRGGKICTKIAGALSLVALVLMIAGITHRSIIMQRSPIGNLYDTILFIGASGVLVMLLIEVLTKRAVSLGLAVFMGLACMFLARRYEIGDAKDHMDPLVAVLKSNFWLSTHVVTIVIGYMGGLAAAGLSAIYLFARVLGIDEGDKNFRRAMTRIAYGMICFTLFFSLIGTVLGGIWANDSWGRFWGWDPKENGALMIVLWSLILLHARMAGYLREWGLHIANVFGANIVAFSWWHVNSLGTGLHSYGFIDGLGVIWGFYGLLAAVCLMGGICAWLEKRAKKQAQASGLK